MPESGKLPNQSLAIAYNMKRKNARKKMAEGGPVGPTIGSQIGYPGASKTAPVKKAMGGMIDGDEDDMKDAAKQYGYGRDVVDHVMKKRYSEGGKVANETPVTADLEENDFDDLDLDDDLEFGYTAANSGDEQGNAQESEDRADVVAKIMRQRKMKDRNPVPA